MADLIIRGMEIPKERSLWLCVKTDGTVYNIKPGGIGTAHAVGTAVTLPAGHGRLIDADDLVSVLDILVSKGGGSPVWNQMRLIVGSMVTIVPAEGGTEDG